jgi:hypothetical protein
MPLLGPEVNSFWKNAERIYKVVSVSSGTDEVVMKEIATGNLFRERFAIFTTAYTRVLKIGEVASLLNKTPRSIYRYEAKGVVKKQKLYEAGNGKLVRFYTLEDVENMRDLISMLHRGRPRKDGRIVNNSILDAGTFKLELKRRFRQ